jgi:3-oxoadipate enol-lactonase
MPYFRDKRRLGYSDSGGEGEALLLLHGLGSRGADWQMQIDALAPEFRVLTLDFAGHGASEPLAGPITLADLAADVRAFLDHLYIPQAHIAGLSLGGMVAFQLAVDTPDRLRSLIVINAAPGPGNQRRWFTLQIALRKGLIHLFSMQALAKRIAPKLFPRADQQALRDQFLDSIALVDRQSYLYIMQAIAQFDVGEGITDCAIPTLILAADRDYTPVAFKREFVRRMKSAQLTIVPNSRHATPLDSPAFCNREIREFLHRLTSPPAVHDLATPQTVGTR